MSAVTVEELKKLFASHLREADRLKRPEGLATGLAALDGYLLWKGIPKGALSLLSGALGSGATSLWIEAASRVVSENRWVAWINQDVPLSPLPLHHKGVNLDRFVSIDPPANEEKLFWLLQELMSSSLFELIGCDLGSLRLKEHQLRKLQAQARDAHVALVFLSPLKPPRGSLASVYSLILRFEKRQLLVERALHRPTPHCFSRSLSYARFTLHTTDRIGLGSPFREADHPERKPSPLPQAPGAAPESPAAAAPNVTLEFRLEVQHPTDSSFVERGD